MLIDKRPANAMDHDCRVLTPRQPNSIVIFPGLSSDRRFRLWHRCRHLCVGLLPATAWAVDEYNLWVAGVHVTDTKLSFDTNDTGVTAGTAVYTPATRATGRGNYDKVCQQCKMITVVKSAKSGRGHID